MADIVDPRASWQASCCQTGDRLFPFSCGASEADGAITCSRYLFFRKLFFSGHQIKKNFCDFVPEAVAPPADSALCLQACNGSVLYSEL